MSLEMQEFLKAEEVHRTASCCQVFFISVPTFCLFYSFKQQSFLGHLTVPEQVSVVLRGFLVIRL